MFLTNIELFHPGAKELLKKGGIAVARSLIPGALSAVDKSAGTIYKIYFQNRIFNANREHFIGIPV